MNFFKGCSLSLCCCDALYRRVLLFVYSYSKNHVPPYLFVSREDDDDVRDIEKHDFRSILFHLLLSNANLKKNSVSSTSPPFWKQSGVGATSRLLEGAAKGIFFFPYPFSNYKWKEKYQANIRDWNLHRPQMCRVPWKGSIKKVKQGRIWIRKTKC